MPDARVAFGWTLGSERRSHTAPFATGDGVWNSSFESRKASGETNLDDLEIGPATNHGVDNGSRTLRPAVESVIPAIQDAIAIGRYFTPHLAETSAADRAAMDNSARKQKALRLALRILQQGTRDGRRW